MTATQRSLLWTTIAMVLTVFGLVLLFPFK